MLNLPPAIVENIRNKETVFFIGAGFSLSAGFPSSGSIASMLAGKLAADRRSVGPSADQLDRVAEKFEFTYGRGRLVSEVESLLRTAPRDALSASHQLLACLVKHGFIRTIVTTNYDTLIEDACAMLGAPITVVAHESQLQAAASDAPVLYKIHGDFAHPELLVLTPADFQRWSLRPETKPIVDQVRALFDKQALLFLGYSLSDFNVLSVLLGSESSTRGVPRHKRFAAVYAKDSLEDARGRLNIYEVEAFDCPDPEDFLRSILLRLPVKLRIKHLVFNYPAWYPDQQARYGGIETFIQALRSVPGDFVHEEVSVYSRGMLTVDPSQLGNTTYPNYPASFFFFRAAAKAALSTLLHERNLGGDRVPDVIHMHFLEFAPMCEEAGIPTLCTSHSLLSRDLAYTKGLFDGKGSAGAKEEVMAAYNAEKSAASAARFVTVISAAHEQEVRDLGARGVRRLDPPFDPQQFIVEGQPQSARQRAHIQDKFTITYVGRPDRRKGIEVLIGACEALANEGTDFQLLLVGYGFSHRDRQLAFGMGRFVFDTASLEKRGIRVELREAYNSRDAGLYYSASDVVVVPSLYEPMGYVVLEAMACGRPVVAARVGGIVETVVDGQNGLLFESGDAQGLFQKLLYLSRDRDAGRRLGTQARKDIESRRPLQEVVQGWHELYRQAAFAFGESLYPSPETVQIIQRKCEKVDVRWYRDLSAYLAAELGCGIAKEIMTEHEKDQPLAEGVPVNSALLRTIAVELQRTLRRRGITLDFSAAELNEIMIDLSLALLNREKDAWGLYLTATETSKRLRESWFHAFADRH